MAQANNILGPILLHAPRMQQFFRLLWNLSGETVPHGGILSGSLSKSTLTFRKNMVRIRELRFAADFPLPGGKIVIFLRLPADASKQWKGFLQ